jgi:hypothetical protein
MVAEHWRGQRRKKKWTVWNNFVRHVREKYTNYLRPPSHSVKWESQLRSGGRQHAVMRLHKKRHFSQVEVKFY